jgi:hypothetical protein
MERHNLTGYKLNHSMRISVFFATIDKWNNANNRNRERECDIRDAVSEKADRSFIEN